jgi:hypothetical protein
MKQLRNTALTMAAGVALAITAFAQQPTTSTDQPKQGMQMDGGQMQPGGKMSGAGKMQGCHKEMQSMMDANTQTTKDIEAAKLSNDPEKMRAALDEAEKALKPMNEHMKKCMGMMQNMHGKGGMMGGMMGGQQGHP